MEKEKESGNGKKRCKDCNSKFTYVRIKDGSLVCRSCGHITPKEERDGS